MDAKLAELLSSFFLDVSKAWFVALFITFDFSGDSVLLMLSRLMLGLFNVIFYVYLSWKFSKISKKWI